MAAQAVCKIEGCGKRVNARGWCAGHYGRWKKFGDPFRIPPPFVAQECSIEGCHGVRSNKGYCNRHYLRLKRHGNPLGGGPDKSARGAPIAWMRDHLSFAGHDCLLWPFGRTGSGYGAIYDGGPQELAHRWVCERIHGAPPTEKHEAVHSCGRGHDGCVHPKHLSWGTGIENAGDRWRHGTQPHGESAPNVKLTEAEVLSIWGLRDHQTENATARQFGVSKATIGWIWTGRSWSWLTGTHNDSHRARRRAKRVGRG